MSALDRQKLAKLIALAESPNDHEALIAVRKASTLARSAGLSLGEAVGGTNTVDNGLVTALAAAQATIAALQRQVAARSSGSMTWPTIVRRCLAHPDVGHLSAWEQDFLRSLLRFQRLSEKQRPILARISDKLLLPEDRS